MAAPIGKWRCRESLRILQCLGVNRLQFQSLITPRYTRTISSLINHTAHSHEVRYHGFTGSVVRTLGVPHFRFPTRRELRLMTTQGNIFTHCLSAKNLSTSSVHCRPSDEESPQKEEHRLRLMDFTELIWPNPMKTLKNVFMAFLIANYMDPFFTQKNFLAGTEQAIATVSKVISSGQFDDLDGLVDRESVHEIRQNYQELTPRQKQMIAVDPRDIFYRFIHEIGMIFDDKTNKRFVEITTVYQGYVGLGDMKERGETPSDQDGHSVNNAADNVYICNYRLIREYTKGIESDWTINKLNHFFPKELVQKTNFFDR